jgi:hypothetical protein
MRRNQKGFRQVITEMNMSLFEVSKLCRVLFFFAYGKERAESDLSTKMSTTGSGEGVQDYLAHDTNSRPSVHQRREH